VFLEEDREVGNISFKTFIRGLQVFGGLPGIIVLTMITATANLGDYGAQWLILQWTDSYIAKDSKEHEYLYLILACLMTRNILNGLRGLYAFTTVAKAARKVHSRMLFRVIHSKLGEFLQRIPSGQIINRFTKDIDKIDTTLGGIISLFTLEVTLVIIDLSVVIWTTSQLFLILPCFVFLYFGVIYQRRYMSLKRELTRLQNITNSPVIGWCTAVLKSCAEVRVLRKEGYVRRIFRNLIDENTKNSIIIFGLDAWFETRIAVLNLLLVQIPSYGYVFYVLYSGNGDLDIKKIILFILSSTKLTTDMCTLLIILSQFETSMVSVERCQAFEQIEPEENYEEFKKHEKLYTMPKKNAITEILKNDHEVLFPEGKVELINLTAKYPTKKIPVLKNLTLEVQPGEKVGIVGRTGAGKTSFIKLFWKCLDSQEGQLLIDGKDINTLDLKRMRREIMVISQETALFAGTLRENIEPTLEYMFGEKDDSKKSKKKK
jgi:ABC-type multidrug transport system fused ATPase/permease subunit